MIDRAELRAVALDYLTKGGLVGNVDKIHARMLAEALAKHTDALCHLIDVAAKHPNDTARRTTAEDKVSESLADLLMVVMTICRNS
jgi:hypothetical protein